MNTLKRTISRPVYLVLMRASKEASRMKNAWITPEHVLLSMEEAGVFCDSPGEPGKNATYFRDRLAYFLSCLPKEEEEGAQMVSGLLQEALTIAIETAGETDAESVEFSHLIFGLSMLRKSLAGYLLRKNPEILTFSTNKLNRLTEPRK